jgi:hypothetical protein
MGYYGYNQFGYAQPQPHHSQQYNELLDKVNRLGNMIEGRGAYAEPNQANYGTGNNQSHRDNYNPNNSNWQTPQVTLIRVKSAEEAWKHHPDMLTGDKQVFFNEEKDEFYAQWFDAGAFGGARTIRKMYRESISAEGNSEEPQSEIKVLEDKIDWQMRQLAEIKEMIENGKHFTSGLEIFDAEVPRSERDNGESDGNGKTKRVARGSNGRFRADSAV